MRNSAIVLAAFCVSVVAISAQTRDQDRIAVVEDVAGVKTDVMELRASFNGSEKFSSAYNAIGLSMPDYELAIPVERIVSITTSGKTAGVTVDWRGQQWTASGTLLKGSLTGKSDFGDFTLGVEKIKQLGFKSPPTRQSDPNRSPQSGTLFLANGREIQLTDIQRHDSFYSSEGYILGGRTRYNHYKDIRFMRGESVATVKFSDLQRLEFDSAGAVSVILRNGNSASGKLASDNEAGVKGWTGEAENGLVFVSPGAVRAVAFASVPGK